MEIVQELKSTYFDVKRKTNDLRQPIEICFTGDELFHLTIRLQTLHPQIPVTVSLDDLKWIGKLMNYIQPYPENV